MKRRIVCWITPDFATVVAAKLAIRENEHHAGGPLPLVVVACGHNLYGWHVRAMKYLDFPVIRVRPSQERLYRTSADVHVIGVPVDEQEKHDAWVERYYGLPVLSVLADRCIRRDDVYTLLNRSLRGVRVTRAEVA